MTQTNDTVASVTALSITRVFDAPRELVFKAWIDPEHLGHWSGPEGFTSSHDYFDPTPGGAYRACLRAPDGTEHWVRGTYREVSPSERLVFTHAWENDAGGTSPETVVTVVLTDRGGRTLMEFHQAPFARQESRDGHEGGWSSSFDGLARYLGTVQSKTVEGVGA